MIAFGGSALAAGFLFAVGAAGAAAYGAFRRERALVDAAERAILLASAMAWMAAATLVGLMLARDYRVAYVWEYTSNTLPPAYTVTALWAGQAGSLLWWLCLLSATIVLAARTTLRHQPILRPWSLAILAAISAFFFALVIWAADPFQLLAERYPDALGHRPAEGQGLNPQLQNFGMIIHPPLLYLGYILFSIPFSLALSSLATNCESGFWVRASRPWTMAAWAILGFGILCGMKWAYVELGWGGYWAWDPVENASLLPWLTGTALLHSAMAEERLGVLRRWNYLLAILTFLLSVFGTFLTRSGILSSVHAFAQSDVGPFFINFFAAWGAIGSGLLAFRWRELKPLRAIEGVLSREALFLFQNLLLVGLAAAVFWGTMYPIVSERMLGEKVTVSAPYYDQVAVPIGLAVYLLMGCAPFIPWRRANAQCFLRLAALPLAVAALAAGGQRLLLGGTWASVAGNGLAVFTLTVLIEDLRGAAASRRRSAAGAGHREGWIEAAARVIDRRHRRYGGFLAHAGMAVLLLGLAGAAFNREAEARLAPGERLQLAPWTLELEKVTQGHDGHREFVRAELGLREHDRVVRTVRPEISIYFAGQDREQRNTEVAIVSSPLRDLYVILVEPVEGGAVVRLLVQPLVLAVWAGGFLVLLGSILALIPDGAFSAAFRSRSRPECPSCGEVGTGELHCWNCGASPSAVERSA